MSKILEFFGLAKPENSQPPMAPPAPKDSQPPGLLGRPVESVRATQAVAVNTQRASPQPVEVARGFVSSPIAKVTMLAM